MSKKNFTNQTHIEGYVYEHNLELKVAGEKAKNPGVEFINGTLSVAIDEEMMNVIQIHYSYVTELTSAKKPNATFTVLKSIIDGKIGSVMEHGKENAGKIRADSAIGLNEWYDMKTTSGEPHLISQKRNEGGFVHLKTDELGDPKTRATFNTDMVITRATRVEANEERGLPEKVVLKGYIFNFRKELLPVEYTVLAHRAMDYFEDLEPSEREPVFTRVQGIQISQTIVRKIEEESAFGDPIIREVRSSNRDFVVNWASPTPYPWDDETSILASEFSTAITNREIYLATLKKRQDEYEASKNNALSEKFEGTKKDTYNF